MFLHSKKGYKNSYIKDRKSFDCYSHWLATVIKYKLKTALTRQRLLADSYESEAPSSQVSAKAEEHSNTIRVVKSAEYSMFLHSKKGYKNSYIKDRKSFDCYSHW